jgi:hypothetical protein
MSARPSAARSPREASPPFTELISFLARGVVVESRRYAVRPGPPFGTLLETTAHGAWKRTGNRTYEAFFRFLLQDLASTGEVGTDNVTLELTLDGDTLTGTFTSVIRDPADDPAGVVLGDVQREAHRRVS